MGPILNRIFYNLSLLAALSLVFTPHAFSEDLQASIKGSGGSSLKIRYSKKWESLGQGIAQKEVSLISGDSFVWAVLKFIKLDSAHFKIKVLSSARLGQKQGFFVRTHAEKSDAILMINGSYFDEKRRPLGFLVSNGERIKNRVVTNWIYSGFFYVRNGKPFMASRKRFKKERQMDQALQAGPLLFSRGKPVKKIKNLHASHFRSGIGLTRKSEVLVFATDTRYGGVSWYELQQVLLLSGLEVYHAMNLDGGGSTQMALRTKKKKEFIDGISRVPVAIGFFKRETGK